MPEDLFRTVVVRRPAGHRFGAVPLSVAVHSVVIAVAIIVPLLATDVLPRVSIPLVMQLSAMPAVVVPTPPILPVGRPRIAPVVAQSTAAPVTAPTGIANTNLAVVADPGPEIRGVDLDVISGVTPGAMQFEVPPPPREETKPVVPVRVGGKVLPPRRIRSQAPVYPPIAAAARVQGTVVIEAIIGITGEVEQARVVTSVLLLDEAALAAVREWRFTPTLLNGVPVPVIMTVRVEFTLR